MLDSVSAASTSLRERLRTRPVLAIIAGSGIMRAFADVEIVAEHDMASIPGLPLPGVAGHGRSVLECRIGSTDVLVATGRLHLYEGHPTGEITTFIDVIADLGIRSLILTNATGGLAPGLSVGDVMLPSDVMNLTFKTIRRSNPLRPAPDSQWLHATMERCQASHVHVTSGTYAQVTGPSYETRAEIRMLRSLGADTVGMSTAIELLYASTRGIRTLICSMVTNTLTDTAVVAVHHDDVLHAADNAVLTMSRVVTEAVGAHADLFLPS